MAEKVDKKAHISSPSLSNNEKKRKPTDADFRFLFLSLGNRSMTPDLTPGTCPHDCHGGG